MKPERLAQIKRTLNTAFDKLNTEEMVAIAEIIELAVDKIDELKAPAPTVEELNQAMLNGKWGHNIPGVPGYVAPPVEALERFDPVSPLNGDDAEMMSSIVGDFVRFDQAETVRRERDALQMRVDRLEAITPAFWTLEEFKIWKGLDREKPQWACSIHQFCFASYGDAIDMMEYVSGNCPERLFRVAAFKP